MLRRRWERLPWSGTCPNRRLRREAVRGDAVSGKWLPSAARLSERVGKRVPNRAEISGYHRCRRLGAADHIALALAHTLIVGEQEGAIAPS